MTSHKRFEIFYSFFFFYRLFISVWIRKQNLYSKKKLQITTARTLIYFISTPCSHTFRRCYLHLVLLASSRKKFSKLVKPTRKRFPPFFFCFIYILVFLYMPSSVCLSSTYGPYRYDNRTSQQLTNNSNNGTSV